MKTRYEIMHHNKNSDSPLFDTLTNYSFKYKWQALLKMWRLNKTQDKKHKRYYVATINYG